MLKHRLLSAAGLLAFFFGSAYFMPAIGVYLILVGCMTVAILEMYSLMDQAKIPVFRFYGLVCGIGMISATYFNIGPAPTDMLAAYRWETAVLFAAVVCIFIRQFPQKYNEQPLETVACTLLGILYVPFLFNFITRLLFAWEPNDGGPISATGRNLIFYLVLVTKVTDAGAYFVGREYGKTKLFPRLSPSKTWEGLAGGVATAIVASTLYCMISGGRIGVLELSIWDALILGVLLAVVGAIGDLFESLLKRASGAKDSGSMLPGMGGILDVLDSLLFSAPVLYAYALFFMEAGA